MEHITAPFKEIVTPEQYANAKTHWEKLILGKISGGFEMGSYTKEGDGQEYLESKTNVCMTCACSGGYLPETLAISFDDILKYVIFDRIQFSHVIRDYLGIDNRKTVNSMGSGYGWCFSRHWDLIDNSAKGAGIRMRIIYEEGLPKNWSDQMWGLEPLMYEHELKNKVT